MNRHAGSLATLASSLDNEIPRLITVELLCEPSIDPHVGISAVSALGSSWMDLSIEFLVVPRLDVIQRIIWRSLVIMSSSLQS